MDASALGEWLPLFTGGRDGIGKDAAGDRLVKERLSAGKSVIVCPASVVPVWISEFEKFAPELKAKTVQGKAGFLRKHWVGITIVTSFALMRNRIDRLVEEEFEYAIIDEAQFIKNPDAKVTRAALRIKARNRVALSGTPIENKPLDIWPSFPVFNARPFRESKQV